MVTTMPMRTLLLVTALSVSVSQVGETRLADLKPARIRPGGFELSGPLLASHPIYARIPTTCESAIHAALIFEGVVKSWKDPSWIKLEGATEFFASPVQISVSKTHKGLVSGTVDLWVFGGIEHGGRCSAGVLKVGGTVIVAANQTGGLLFPTAGGVWTSNGLGDFTDEFGRTVPPAGLFADLARAEATQCPAPDRPVVSGSGPVPTYLPAAAPGQTLILGKHRSRSPLPPR